MTGTKTGHPPLIVTPADEDCRPTGEVLQNIKDLLMRQRETGEVIVLAFPVNIWQFVDGKWEPLPQGDGALCHDLS